MTKQKVGTVLHYAAYVALAGAALLALKQPALIALLGVGAATFFLGRQIERLAN